MNLLALFQGIRQAAQEAVYGDEMLKQALLDLADDLGMTEEEITELAHSDRHLVIYEP